MLAPMFRRAILKYLAISQITFQNIVKKVLYLEEEEDLVLQTNDEMCSSCNGTKLDMSKETLHPSDLDSGLAAYRTYVDLCT